MCVLERERVPDLVTTKSASHTYLPREKEIHMDYVCVCVLERESTGPSNYKKCITHILAERERLREKHLAYVWVRVCLREREPDLATTKSASHTTHTHTCRKREREIHMDYVCVCVLEREREPDLATTKSASHTQHTHTHTLTYLPRNP